MNGGQCTELFGRAECNCNPGYTGRYCDNEIDECASNPCENDGSCIDGFANYVCLCELGFMGLNCEIGKYNSRACSKAMC